VLHVGEVAQQTAKGERRRRCGAHLELVGREPGALRRQCLALELEPVEQQLALAARVRLGAPFDGVHHLIMAEPGWQRRRATTRGGLGPAVTTLPLAREQGA
jgi:hypothetical protein